VFEATKSPIAEEALRRIGELYRIEAEISGRVAEPRLSARQEQAVQILTQLRTWLEEQRRRLSSKTEFAKAIQYALTCWDALPRYAGDGGLAIDIIRPNAACAV
jgi:transposase